MADQACRVYVHNLAFSVTDETLRDVFSGAGNVVSAVVLRRSGDGRSKGCGLVSFGSPQEAQRAIAELSDTEVEGRKILVREDRDAELPVPRAPRGAAREDGGAPRQSGGAPGGGAGGEPGTTLYVGNLPWSASWTTLKDVFRNAGFSPAYTNVQMGRDGRSRGWGTARFATPDDAAAAIDAVNGVELEGRKLIVRLDEKA